MKTLRTTAMGIMATALCLFTSCVEDETHDADTEINVVNIENIEDSYTALSNIDRVVIEPKVTGSLYVKTRAITATSGPSTSAKPSVRWKTR